MTPKAFVSSIFTYLGEYFSLLLFRKRVDKSRNFEKRWISKASLSKFLHVGHAIWATTLFE